MSVKDFKITAIIILNTSASATIQLNGTLLSELDVLGLWFKSFLLDVSTMCAPSSGGVSSADR